MKTIQHIKDTLLSICNLFAFLALVGFHSIMIAGFIAKDKIHEIFNSNST